MDPRTPGGLLIAVAARACEELVGALQKAGFPARRRIRYVGEGAGVEVA